MCVRERDSSKDSIEAVLDNKEDYNYRVAYYEEIDSMPSSLFSFFLFLMLVVMVLFHLLLPEEECAPS